MPDVTDLLGFAIDKNPTEFASAIDDILRSKAAIALENKKTELAQSVYGSDEDPDEVDFETDDLDLDDDTDTEFDEEDFDIDLDDLDLEDLDLDNLDGDELDA
jgi:hypothetical protein